ncbi:MAG: helix-turn-helix transcriptional regulator [Pseudomonadota bacterium]
MPITTHDPEAVARRIAAAMARAGIVSDSELARRAGRPKQTIRNLTKAVNRAAQVDVILDVANALGVTVSELLGERPAPALTAPLVTDTADLDRARKGEPTGGLPVPYAMALTGPAAALIIADGSVAGADGARTVAICDLGDTDVPLGGWAALVHDGGWTVRRRTAGGWRAPNLGAPLGLGATVLGRVRQLAHVLD